MLRNKNHRLEKSELPKGRPINKCCRDMHLPDIESEHDACDVSRIITVTKGSDLELKSLDGQGDWWTRSMSLRIAVYGAESLIWSLINTTNM